MKRLVIYSLVLNLLVLAVAGMFVQRKGGLPYLADKFQQAQPRTSPVPASPTYRGHATTFAAMPAAEGAIIFAGDSLTAGCAWHELLGRPDILNRGIAGDTVAGLKNRLGEIVRHRPRAIFLMIGINDMLYHKPSEQLVREYLALVDEIKAALPATRLYLQSILPVDSVRLELDRDLDETIVRANAAIAAAARDAGIVFVDLYPMMATETGRIDDRYTSDGVHLSAAGYARWREGIAAYIAAIARTETR